MKKYTKFMGILLTLVMLIALVPITAMADVSYKKRDDCDIVISKAVEGSNASADDEFGFEITFCPNIVEPDPYQPPIVYSANAAAQVNVPPAIGAAVPAIYKTLADGSTYDFEAEAYDAFHVDEDGKVTGRFKLKHGESLHIMNAADRNKPVTVTELDNKGYSTVVNGVSGTKWETNAPNTDTVSVNFVNTKEAAAVSDSFTVEKKWSDGNDKHANGSITVQLYRNGAPYSLTMFGRIVDDGRVVLSAANGWQHTWSGLEAGYKWTVAELNVPNGYVSAVNYYGCTAVITNTAAIVGLPQTGDGGMGYIGALLVLAAMAIAVVIAGKERD